MNTLSETGPAFIEMAHRIVWCSVATVDSKGRPRSRILHPFWQWDGTQLVGWICTSPTPVKRAHLKGSPYVSVNYWLPNHDTCLAECRATMHFDVETKRMVWDLFVNAPEPVGYVPSIVPAWTSPEAEALVVLRLEPWRLRVMPGTVMLRQGGSVLTWQE